MTIATKSGGLIVKDGRLAQNCGCCSPWSCWSNSATAGACCDGTTCRISQDCECVGPGKVFKGVGTTCAQYSGACCTNGVCSIANECECVGDGKVFKGVGTTCGPSVDCCDSCQLSGFTAASVSISITNWDNGGSGSAREYCLPYYSAWQNFLQATMVGTFALTKDIDGVFKYQSPVLANPNGGTYRAVSLSLLLGLPIPSGECPANTCCLSAQLTADFSTPANESNCYICFSESLGNFSNPNGCFTFGRNPRYDTNLFGTRSLTRSILNRCNGAVITNGTWDMRPGGDGWVFCCFTPVVSGTYSVSLA